MAIVTLLAGCGVLSPEEQLLTRFFEASRLNDTTQAARFATVAFNPRVDGVVQDFEIERIVEEGDTKRLTVRAMVRPLGGSAAPVTLFVTVAPRDGRPTIVGVRAAP